ncbi:MAG: DUF5676 family membrane protein [bacterium]|nr:DUF5676 family membrane protein [bacterium]
MKFQQVALANAIAATTAVIYVVCALAIALFPDASMMIAKSWFHGIDISKIYYNQITAGSLVLGLITSIIGSWLLGYMFARFYNSFAGK